MVDKKPETKKRTELDDKVTITSQRPASFYVFIGKNALAHHPTIELHALGLAMSVCVSAADMLIKYSLMSYALDSAMEF